MPNWTTEQQQAIYTRGCNLLVSAAAGSGKTAVLVERIIQMVCDQKTGVDIDKLLIVTFTSAAAAEMKERIGMAINEELKKQPHSKHLYRQSTLLNKASIMTLHSFCLEIVRENFYRLGIDPHFRIADDTEGELLRLDVLEELLELYYAKSDEDDFTKLIDAYGGQRDDSLIQELILKLYNFSRSNPWPEHWLQQMQANFTTTNWFESLLISINMELVGARALLAKAYNLAQAPNGPAAYVNNLREELWAVDDLIGAAKVSWQQLHSTFPAVEFKRLPSIKKKDQVDSELQDKVKELRTKAKDKVKALETKYFNRPQQDLLEDLITLQPHMKMLCQLVTEFSQAYQQQKAKRNLVDFNDLEHFCLKLLLADESTQENLVPSEISDKMRAKFAEVLVDEYQDINDVQETILQLVTKPDNMFMVGDVKQSIYRFRLAKPELFLNKYQSYSPTEGASERRLDLARNFRCRSEVVDGVNFIFQQIMTAKLGEMPYDDNARLIYGANYPDTDDQLSLAGPLELHLLEKKNSAEQEQPDELDEQQELTAFEKEARVIGQRIKELMATEHVVYDKNTDGYRPLTWRDIVILMRSPKGAAESLMEQFRLMGIPVYADLGSGYFAATEVQTMLALLKIIDNPHQDIPLGAVLRSPLLGLTAKQLAEIRLTDVSVTFYTALLKTVAKDSPLADVLKGFLANLERWRTLARQGNLADLIWTLYRETGYFNYVGAMPEGGQRQANLRALHDRARQYEATSFRGLFKFLRFLERLQENKGDMEAAKALGENENVVRVMSIHKSKGLEFPVVFVAGMGKQFNLSDVRQDVILHKELGLGPVFIDAEKRIKYPTVAKMAIENKIKLETLAEEMRILYVALTRAREKLIMVGSVNDVVKAVDNWCRVLDYDGIALPDSELAQAKTFLDWVGPAIVRHSDGDVLRKLVNNTDCTNLVPCSSQWQIVVHSDGQGSTEDEQIAEILEDIKALQPVPIKSELADLINNRLSWHYHQQPLTEKKAKVTVTEIKHKFHQLAQQAEGFSSQLGFTKRPVFMQKNKGLSAAEKGSAIHLVMQHIDLSKPINDDNIQELLADLELREIVTAEQRQVIDTKVILDFFHSPLGARIIKVAQVNSNLVKREMPFSLTLPAQQIYDDLNDHLHADTEKVLVQGVIDCMWPEADGWVLVDYKSDNVSAHQVAEFISRYQGQVNLYAQAVATILKQPVKERYLYLFSLGQAVQV